MVNNTTLSSIMVIFGGTGDLTHRKLIPALYNLECEGLLPEDFAIVGVGRRSKSNEDYRKELFINLNEFSRNGIINRSWEKLSSKIYYFELNFNDSEEYEKLKSYLAELDNTYKTLGNRLYYLSVAPSYFEIIAQNLKNNSMAQNIDSWQRLVIEKPFGKNLETAKYLNKVIGGVFPEENIFRIDHYLGKEMLQNLLVIRFGNAMFENIWNNKFIDNIQITAFETVGVENRADYYESSGALLDMVQNHLLQLLSLISMEPPISLDAKDIKLEKVKIMRSLGYMKESDIDSNIIRGQYTSGTQNTKELIAYRDEKGVNPESHTETFTALKLYASNYRWGKMPFYLRTGKRMNKKSTYIVIEFKSAPDILYFKEFSHMQPNLLIINIQPKEGISFQFNTKQPGSIGAISNEHMIFCQNCSLESSNSPEAYERLIADALKNDQTLFTGWDEVEASWSFIDNISKVWKENTSELPLYSAGSSGPKEVEELMLRDGRKWWDT